MDCKKSVENERTVGVNERTHEIGTHRGRGGLQDNGVQVRR